MHTYNNQRPKSVTTTVFKDKPVIQISGWSYTVFHIDFSSVMYTIIC